MPRELSTEVETASTSQTLSPIALVELEFDSGFFRMWTGWGTLVWGVVEGEGEYQRLIPGGVGIDETNADETLIPGSFGIDQAVSADRIWYGAGDLGTIGPIEETTEVRAVGVELGLSGITTEILDIALGETWQGRLGRIYIGVLDSEGQIDGEPFNAFEGPMDRMTLIDGSEAAIKLQLETEQIDLERANGLRYTPESQRARYADDKFFDYVASMQEGEIPWGVAG